MNKHKDYDLAISGFSAGSYNFFIRLYSYFKSSEEIWLAPKNSIIHAGVNAELAQKFIEHRLQYNIQAFMESYERHKINIVPFHSDSYPKRLKEIFSPPYFLFIKGELPSDDIPHIAVVGSRRGSDYGRRATKEIATGLAVEGVVIVSGLALGLDTEAHKAAVENKRATIAVLANGLERVYPAFNMVLAKKILEEGGAIVSEYPIGTPPLKQHFPARNRIISGLSDGVLITEAGEHSGTLHTASFAIEQNRQIYAIPGAIYNPLSKGPNSLIREGAKAVTHADDILVDLGIEGSPKKKSIPEGDEEEYIFRILDDAPKHIDEISKNAPYPGPVISKVLTLMEIKGKVRHLGGMVYSLNN